MIQSVTIIVISAIAGIAAIEILRPVQDHTQVITILVGLITMAVGQLITLMKQEEAGAHLAENSRNIADIKIATNGQTEHAVKQAAEIATLTEKVESAKTAAEVAANATAATAAALLKKAE